MWRLLQRGRWEKHRGQAGSDSDCLRGRWGPGWGKGRCGEVCPLHDAVSGSVSLRTLYFEDAFYGGEVPDGLGHWSLNNFRLVHLRGTFLKLRYLRCHLNWPVEFQHLVVWFSRIFIKIYIYGQTVFWWSGIFFLSFPFFDLYFHSTPLTEFYLSVIYCMLENLFLFTLPYLCEATIIYKWKCIHIFQVYGDHESKC